VLAATRTGDVQPTLAAVEERVNRDGLFAAGFVAYEAAAGFDAAMTTAEPGDLPLVAFGLFETPQELDVPDPAGGDVAAPAEWEFDTDRDAYAADIRRIHDEIAAGNCYQVNYTLRAVAKAAVEPWPLFCRMAGSAPFAAYIESDDHAIVSASPELFFRLEGEMLTSRPMKGTAARGLDAQSDRARRDALERSVKDRAENVMIVDMIRNDMGRVAVAGSVKADALYEIEKYPTVWQATSTITARTHAAVTDIFGAMFPCASITGAPKLSTMRLIRELERSPRGVYTGAIGWIAPGRRAQFSVAIRTAVVDRRTGRASYGVGGGIVWDSAADDEYAECRAKTEVLRRSPLPRRFGLFETLLWRWDGGFRLLDRHLARMQASAAYFDFPCDVRELEAGLEAAVADAVEPELRVRLTLQQDGSIAIDTGPVEHFAGGQSPRVRLCEHPVDAGDVRLYHKTTDRSIYEQALEHEVDCDDVILWNARACVTESTIANLLCRFGDEWVTPPVDSGLLPGTARDELLAAGEVSEREISISEIQEADAIELVNSVRGRYRVELVLD